MPKSIYKTVRFTPELWEWIEAQCIKEGRNPSNFIFNVLNNEMRNMGIAKKHDAFKVYWEAITKRMSVDPAFKDMVIKTEGVTDVQK